MTGQNKIEFEKWYLKNLKGYKDPRHLEQFKKRELEWLYESFFEMQIGVYLAYYDSVGLTISLDGNMRFNWKIWYKHKKHEGIDIKTRNEAYKEAFKKADELRNKQLTKN